MADRDNQSGWPRPSGALLGSRAIRCRLSSQGAWKGRTCPELTSQSLNTDLHPGVLWIRCDSDYRDASIQLSTIQPNFVYPCQGNSARQRGAGDTKKNKLHIFFWQKGRETTAACCCTEKHTKKKKKSPISGKTVAICFVTLDQGRKVSSVKRKWWDIWLKRIKYNETYWLMCRLM